MQGSCAEQTSSELASSGKDARLGKESQQETGLDGDRTSGRETKTGAISHGLDTGTLGVVTQLEIRHEREGKNDAVVVARRCDDVHNTDDEALRESV